MLEGIYCGKENCYDVLELDRSATKRDIAKKYRLLAKKYHPDLHRDAKAKEIASEQFKSLANAYEILKDEGARADYDYMLDNPDEYYANYYRYYRRRVAPQVDVRLVIFVTITIISVVQYYSKWQNYDRAIRSFMMIPKYKNQAIDIAKQDGLLPVNDKRSRKISKAQFEEDKERIIRQIIEEKMDIKGAYAKPTIQDILWIQLITLPYTLFKWFYWYVSWFVRHTILKQPYNDEEKLYIIRKYLKMNPHQFETELETKRDLFFKKELWIRENFDLWFEEERETFKKQLAENTKYKQYRRYIKNHGVGRMTFDDS